MNEFDYKGWVYGNISDTAPESSTSEGHKGQICIDENYMYICVGENTWKRVKLSNW